MPRIRTANPAQDTPAILEIYRPYVERTPVTFELELPSRNELQRRVAETIAKYPWLVCEEAGEILGYAYAGPFRTRVAYTWSLETSVYVREDVHGRRIGSALYEALLQVLKDQGVVNVVGGITLPNEASVKLHEAFGFVKVAQFPDTGFKLGRWWDVGFWHLQLQRPEIPSPLRLPDLLEI